MANSIQAQRILELGKQVLTAAGEDKLEAVLAHWTERETVFAALRATVLAQHLTLPRDTLLALQQQNDALLEEINRLKRYRGQRLGILVQGAQATQRYTSVSRYH